jgi:hypothetical protein
LDFPGDMNLPFILSKIQGFKYLRADMHVRIVVNKMPFHQGALVLWYHPFEKEQNTPERYQSMMSWTGFPHETLNIMKGTTIEASAKFAAPFTHFDLNDPRDIGRFHLNVLSPLSTASTAGVVDLTVYTWFENIELSWPTGTDSLLQPQGVSGSSKVETPIQVATAPGMPSASQSSNAKTFGATSTSRTNVFGSPSVNDFETIITDANYLKTFEVSSTNHNGDIIAQFDASPYSFRIPYPNDATNFYVPKVSFISRMFQYTRMMLRFKFIFCMTEFHSCRLAFEFTPNKTAGYEKNNVYRKVVDVKGIEEFEFDVPFVLNRPFANLNEVTGLVTVRVVNTLVAPDSVAPTFEVLTFVSAVPNTAEFAFPIIGRNLYKSRMVAVKEVPKVFPQGIMDETQDGADDISTQTHLKGLHKFTTGEKNISSVLELCNRSILVSSMPSSLVGETQIISPYYIPDYVDFNGLEVDGVVDYISVFSQIFRFFAGSVDMTIVPLAQLGNNTVMTVALANDYIGDRFLTNAITKDDVNTLSYAPTNVINTRVDAAPTFTTPFYVPYLFSITGMVVDQTNISIGGYSPTFGYSVNFPDACNVYRAAGSDFQYASMIGVPALSYVTPGVEARVDHDWEHRSIYVATDAHGAPNLIGSYLPFSGASVIIGDSDIDYENPPTSVVGLSLGENGIHTPTTSFNNFGCALNIGPLSNFSKQLTRFADTPTPTWNDAVLNYYTHDDSEINVGVPTPFVTGSYHGDVVNMLFDGNTNYSVISDSPFVLIGFDYTYSSSLVGTQTRMSFTSSEGAMSMLRDSPGRHQVISNPPTNSGVLWLNVASSSPDFTVTKIHYICIDDMTVIPIPL